MLNKWKQLTQHMHWSFQSKIKDICYLYFWLKLNAEKEATVPKELLYKSSQTIEDLQTKQPAMMQW